MRLIVEFNLKKRSNGALSLLYRIAAQTRTEIQFLSIVQTKYQYNYI